MRAKAENTVNLLPSSGEANHRFGTLSIECKRMESQNAKNLLEGNGAFRLMEVRDMLDLAVTDEKLVLGSLSRNCSLSLKFKDIDIVGQVSTSKSFHAQALDGDINLTDAKLSAGGDVGLMSNKGSINLKHSEVEGDSIHMKADRDINIHAGKHPGSRAKASNVRAGKGNAYGNEGRTKGLHMDAGNKIDIYASNLSSEGDMILQGKNGITTRPATTEQFHETKSKGFLNFTEKKTTTTWTDVDKSNITSGGKLIMQSEHGGITSIATDINARENVYLYAKNDIKLLDYVTQRTTRTSKSSWWGLSSSSSYNSQEMSEGTRLVTKGHDPNVIKSRRGNIFIEGSSVESQGKTFMLAEEGDVIFTERILNHEENTESSGFHLTSLSFNHEETNKKYQTVAGNSISCGALEIKAKKFVAQGMEINTNQLIIDALDVEFIGNKLESSIESSSLTISLVPTELKINITEEKSTSKTVEYKNQLINVGGPIVFKKAKNVKLENANLVCDEVKGDVENLEITSKVSTTTKSSHKVSVDVGFMIIGGVPVPVPGVDVDQTKSEIAQVKQISSIHSRQAITTKNLKMKRLQLTGGLISSNQEIEEFSEHVEVHDIDEHAYMISKSTSVKIIPTQKGISSLSFGHLETTNETKRKIRSSVISGTGKTPQGWNVNKNKDAIRQTISSKTETKGMMAHVGKDGAKLQINEVGAGATYSKENGVEFMVKGKNFAFEAGLNKGDGAKMHVKTANTEHQFEVSSKNKKATMTIKQDGKEFSLDAGKEGADIKIKDGDTSVQLKAKESGAQIDIKDKGQSFSIGAGKDAVKVDFNDGDTKFNVGADLKKNKANVDLKLDGTSISAAAGESGMMANVKDGKNDFGVAADFDEKMAVNVNVGDGKNNLNLKTNFDEKGQTFDVNVTDAKNRIGLSTGDSKSLDVELGDGEDKFAFVTDFDKVKKLDVNLQDGNNKLNFSTDFDKKKDLDLQLGNENNKLNFSTDFETKKDLDLGISDGKNKMNFSTDFDKKKELGMELGDGSNKLNFSTDFDKKKELNLQLGDGNNKLSFSTDFDKKNGLDLNLRENQNTLDFSTDFDEKKKLDLSLQKDDNRLAFSTDFVSETDLDIQVVEGKNSVTFSTDFGNKKDLNVSLQKDYGNLTFSTNFNQKKDLGVKIENGENKIVFATDFEEKDELNVFLKDGTNVLDFKSNFDTTNELNVEFKNSDSEIKFMTDFDEKKEVDVKIEKEKNQLTFSTDFDERKTLEIHLENGQNKLDFSTDFEDQHNFDGTLSNEAGKVNFSTDFEDATTLNGSMKNEYVKVDFETNFE